MNKHIIDLVRMSELQHFNKCIITVYLFFVFISVFVINVYKILLSENKNQCFGLLFCIMGCQHLLVRKYLKQYKHLGKSQFYHKMNELFFKFSDDFVNICKIIYSAKWTDSLYNLKIYTNAPTALQTLTIFYQKSFKFNTDSITTQNIYIHNMLEKFCCGR